MEKGDRVRRVQINGSEGEDVGTLGTVERVLLSGKCLHVLTDGQKHSGLYYAIDWEKID